LVLSSADEINDLSEVDVDAVMAAQHEQQRVRHNEALKHFQHRLGTAMTVETVCV